MAKTIVVTAWGRGETVEKIVISRFKNPKEPNSKIPMSKSYCRMVNTLAQGGDGWVHARIVEEEETIDLKGFLPRPDEWSLLPFFDDRAIQKIMRETDSQELARALKISPVEIQEKIFRNMSRRAAEMLKEDMEYMGPVRVKDAEESKQRIVSIIRHLEETGEIVVAETAEEYIR
jgi:hypothetical protein